jgi:hypothetical protein
MNEPKTKAGQWKRKKSDITAEALGKRWCSSCCSMQPKETVRFYKGMQRGTVARCDPCQARRKQAMLERKAA